jgi:hypothetical protein
VTFFWHILFFIFPEVKRRRAVREHARKRVRKRMRERMREHV